MGKLGSWTTSSLLAIYTQIEIGKMNYSCANTIQQLVTTPKRPIMTPCSLVGNGALFVFASLSNTLRFGVVHENKLCTLQPS